MTVAERGLKNRIIDTSAAVAIFSPALMIAVVFIVIYFRILAVTPSMTEYPVRGIDVSHHNGEIDWDKVALQKIKFVYIKASEGNDLQDRRFQQNWNEVRRVGLIPGAFHVFGNCSSGTEQAQNFLSVWHDRMITLPPAVDVSSGPRCKTLKGNQKDELRLFLYEIQSATGRSPIIYDSQTQFAGTESSSGETEPRWVRGIVLDPRVFYGNDWIFWQYSHLGRIDGIGGSVDLNVFQDSEERFAEFLNNGYRPRDNP